MRRSLNDLVGYTIRASDGEIGKVHEFYFDDDGWAIRYAVVDTGGWLNIGRRVLISPRFIRHTRLGITDVSRQPDQRAGAKQPRH